MAKKPRRLGKGLDALFGKDVNALIDDLQQGNLSDFKSEACNLPLSSIRANPYQPRKIFDEKSLQELSESIKLHGVLSPILVRKSIQGYELIAGERRLRASKLAQLETIPAILTDLTAEEMMEIALIENIQREDLNVVDEAKAYQNLMDKLDYTQEQLATRVHKSRSHIANVLRLLQLPQEVLDLVASQQLTMGHVRPLITLDSPEKMIELARLAIKHKWSVRQMEKQCQTKKIVLKKAVKTPHKYDYPQAVMEKKLQTAIHISNHKVVIHFSDDHDLNRILELLGMIEDV